MFEFEFDGYWVVVDSVFIKEPHRGSPWTCDNPYDYHGYSEMDYRVFDEKGSQMFDVNFDEIEEEIIKRYKEEKEEAQLEAQLTQLEAAYF